MGRALITSTFLALSMSSFLYADEVKIPFPVYMEEFKLECKKNGIDLYGKKESDGFVDDKASSFTVMTYKSVNEKQLEIIKDCTWKTIRK